MLTFSAIYTSFSSCVYCPSWLYLLFQLPMWNFSAAYNGFLSCLYRLSQLPILAFSNCVHCSSYLQLLSQLPILTFSAAYTGFFRVVFTVPVTYNYFPSCLFWLSQLPTLAFRVVFTVPATYTYFPNCRLSTLPSIPVFPYFLDIYPYLTLLFL